MVFLPEYPVAETATHGGCIRFDEPSLPYIHENTAHACVGIEGLEIVGTDLRIHLTKRPDGSKLPIVSMFAQFDETMCRLTSLGWSMGLSGGSGYANLRFSKGQVVKPVTDLELYGPDRNIWVTFSTLRDPQPEES